MMEVFSIFLAFEYVQCVVIRCLVYFIVGGFLGTWLFH